MQLNKSSFQKNLHRASELCLKGQINQARDIYHQLIKIFPNHPEVLSNLGTIELQSENISIGIELLKKSISIDPFQVNAIINLGNGLLQQKKYQEAIEKYDRAINLKPSYYESYYNKARALKEEGDFEGAILNYTISINYNADFIFAYINRAAIHFDNKKYFEAIEDYSKAIQIDSSSEFLYWRRGLAYKAIDNKDLALKDFNLAININAHFVEAILERGTILHQNGDLNGALESFSSGLKISQSDADLYYRRSLVYKDMKNFELAEQDCSKALDLNSFFFEAQIDKGYYLEKKGLYIDAIENFKRAISITNCENNLIQAYISSADALNKIKNYNEAIRDCNIVLEIKPSSAEAHINRAAAFNGIGRYEEAVRDCEAAIELDPLLIEAHINLAGALNEIGKYNQAIQSCETAIKINRSNPSIYINKGKIFADLGDEISALQNYEFAISLDHNTFDAYFNAAEIYLFKKNFLKGWDYYEKRNQSKLLRSNFHETNKKPELIDFEIENKDILIFGEQGLGDQIIFLSLLSEIKIKDNSYTVMVDERLIKIYQRSFPEAKFLSKKTPLDEIKYDFYVMSGSLPRFFRKKIEDFSVNKKQYLISDRQKRDELREIIKEDRKICGIAWSSKNNKIGKSKTIKLSTYEKIFNLKNISFVNLQYGDVDQEIKDAEENYNIKIHNLKNIDNTNDIDSLLSLIDACDFVITTSNVTAHLAGSIGKKTYLLLPLRIGRIWYWHDGDLNNIWYPSVKQFPQGSSGSWEEPINKIYELILNETNNYSESHFAGH